MIDKNTKKINLFSGLSRLFLMIGVVALVVPQICLGATAWERLRTVVESKPTYDYGRTTENTLTEYIGNIIAVFLGLLGVIFVILMIYAGYNWMTAAGNVEKVTKAKDTMRAAILGVIITAAVYAIWFFLFARIIQG
jgi:hypothetical protein